MTKQSQLQIQAMLNQAAAADLEILKKYKGKKVIFSATYSGYLYDGVLDSYGNDFVYFTDLSCTGCNFNELVYEQPYNFGHYISNAKKLPDTTMRRVDIEQIVLFNDVSKQREKLFQSQGEAQ